MKSSHLTITCFFLVFFFTFFIGVRAQQEVKPRKIKEKTHKEDYFEPFEEEEENLQDISWKQKGFEIYIGGGIYLGSKKLARYYNGAPENDINLNLLLNNKFYREEIITIMKRAYPAIDTIVFPNTYNYNSGYNIAMDISLGARYRFQKNWYFELSYSFRRLTAQNDFYFIFPNGVPGNKENPPYSKNENLLAKEDRHYIDLSVGYILQKHPVAKPFVSLGLIFNYINIKNFWVFIEDKKPTFDLINIAKYPDYIPGAPYMPNYRVWAGAGYGCSLTAGLKIAFSPSVSIDPVFQLSVGSFGHSRNLPGFNTTPCFNYMAGIRIVMSDEVFVRSVKENPNRVLYQRGSR